MSSIFNEIWSFLKAYWIASAIVLIAVVLVIAYVAGYRVSTGLTVVRVGTLEISDLPPDATVFVDEDLHGSSSTGDMRIPLMPGAHTVIVSESGANPWETIPTIVADQTTTIDPILVPEHAGIVQLDATTTAQANAAISAARIPTTLSPLVLGCASIAVSNNRIIASAATTTGCTPPPYLCTAGTCEPTIIFSPVNTITNVIPYPGHPDAVLVVAGANLDALGLDPRTPQTFAVVLSAPALRAAALPSGAVVVQNATGVYGLSI